MDKRVRATAYTYITVFCLSARRRPSLRLIPTSCMGVPYAGATVFLTVAADLHRKPTKSFSRRAHVEQNEALPVSDTAVIVFGVHRMYRGKTDSAGWEEPPAGRSMAVRYYYSMFCDVIDITRVCDATIRPIYEGVSLIHVDGHLLRYRLLRYCGNPSSRVRVRPHQRLICTQDCSSFLAQSCSSCQRRAHTSDGRK